MSNKLHRRNLILIGCGPHYQDRYHPILEDQQSNILLLIDLSDKRESIIQFFSQKKIKPKKMVFLDEVYRNAPTLEYLDFSIFLDIDLSVADGVLICTEPKVRKVYALWAFLHNFPIFMDKPVSAFTDIKLVENILSDFNEMESTARQKHLDVVVSCERRAHPGYCWLLAYLKDFIAKYRIPITSVDVYFAGGVWNLPQEYIDRENHPFKYGYGILLHSGYHYVDLLVRLLSLNQLITKEWELERNFKLLSSNPKDQITSIGAPGYSYLLNRQEIETALSNEFLCQFNGFGETDVIAIGQDKY